MRQSKSASSGPKYESPRAVHLRDAAGGMADAGQNCQTGSGATWLCFTGGSAQGGGCHDTGNSASHCYSGSSGGTF